MQIASLIICLLSAASSGVSQTADATVDPPVTEPGAAAPAAAPAQPAWDEARTEAALDRLRFLTKTGSPPFPAPVPGTVRDAVQLDAAETLLNQLFASPQAETRLRAVELCATSGEPAHAGRLAAALEDPDARVRERAAAALADIEPGELAGRVLALLGVPDRAEALSGVLPDLRGVLQQPMLDLLERAEAPQETRILAAYALGQMGGRELAEPLARYASGAQARELALACAWALLNLREPSSLEHWLALSGHEDEHMRALALDGLGTLGGEGAVARLFEIARGDGFNGPWLQAQAVRYIGRQPAHEAVPMLVTVMEKNPGMRREAVTRLRQLTRLDFGETPRLWREWLENPAAFMPEPEGEPDGAPIMPDAPAPLTAIGMF